MNQTPPSSGPATLAQNQFGAAVREHQSGRLESAARIYQSILAQDPNHADALHLLGAVALRWGQPQRAVELIGRAIAVNPRVADYHSNRAEAYRALGQVDQAFASGQAALRLQPNFAGAANNLGLAFLAQGKHQDAVAQFRRALELAPDAALFHNNLGNALRLQRDSAEALDHFRQALSLAPNLAEARTNLSQFLLELHQPTEALGHCREAVRLRATWPEAHNNLGNVLREQGRLQEAKLCYTQALELNPNLGLTYSNMGQAVQEEGQLDEAIAWYQKGLRLEPGSPRIHCNLASALAEQEKYEEASARYELALRLDSGYAEAHNGLGAVFHEQGQFETAREHFREAIRLKPDLPSAHCQLGTVLEELSDFDAALSCFRDALRHDPGHAGAYSQMATMLRGKCAEPDLAAMLQLLGTPDLAEHKRMLLHFGLAQVRDGTGDYNQAAEHLRQANALCQAGWQKRGKAYDPAAHAQFVDSLIATFTPEFFARVHGFGPETERPAAAGVRARSTLRFSRHRARHPAVTMPDKGEEERPALVHLVQAQADDLLVFGLVLRDAPAQIDVVQLDAVGQQLLAQRRERHLDEVIALRVHVAEGRGEEHANGFPGSRHGLISEVRICRFPSRRFPRKSSSEGATASAWLRATLRSPLFFVQELAIHQGQACQLLRQL
jgi:tetratricopeptide (TPR) repeat protein